MADQTRALVVDDEGGIRFFLEEVLRRAGYIVAAASSGEEALDRLREGRFDLVLLDLHLGGRVDGMRVLEAIKWRWPETAVVILTAHASLESTLAAIREGVDGYLQKPADGEEIRRTVQEVLARRGRCAVSPPPSETALLTAGDLILDPEKHLATLSGQPLDLTPHEFDLLVYLAQHADRVASPKELVRAIHGYEPPNQWEARQIVKWYVHRLRSKLEPDPAHPRYILNVRGVGYRLSSK